MCVCCCSVSPMLPVWLCLLQYAFTLGVKTIGCPGLIQLTAYRCAAVLREREAVRIYNSGQRALARPRMGRSVGPKHDGPGGRSAYMGENTGRGLAKSVGRFTLRDLPRSFGFPILRNRVPMGFGRSDLDQKMHNFKGFDFVYSKHFFVNDSANQNRAGRLLTANCPSRRSRI